MTGKRIRVHVCVFEAGGEPVAYARVELDLRERARPAHVVVHGDEDTTWTQIADMVAKDVDSVRQVHEQ
jgi:hypothetical protein